MGGGARGLRVHRDATPGRRSKRRWRTSRRVRAWPRPSATSWTSRPGAPTWDEAIEAIQRRYGHYSWVHTINNAALIAAGLLWGRGDYAATVGLTVSGGWDTDSNGATAGSVAGVLLGASSLPGHFVEPLDDRVRSALFGFDDSRISDLAARTTRIALHGLSDGVAAGALVGVDQAVG